MPDLAASPAPRFEPHNRVAGKFRLRKRLAAGGMGEVWVARNESTGADVALKVLRRGDKDREQELQIEERFRHEARLSAMLSHRSIVKVFDLLEEPDGTLVLVMELLRGETLQQYVERKGPRPAREAVAILSPILSALGHAHDCGVVHRDITPANIFLAIDPDGHVTPKLVDFGIAKVVGATSPGLRQSPVQTLDGRVLGTPRYMAPERIRGSTEIDGRTDLFSVAVVLYETMTSISPFSASSPSASLAAVLERHIDPDPRIEPRLWVEIQRAMAKRPYERHSTAGELATALRAATGESEGALATSLKRTHPPQEWEEVLDASPGETGALDERGTIGGQSVAVLPRKRLSSAMWVAAGAVVGALLGVGVFAVRSAMVQSSPAAPQRAAAMSASVPLAASAPAAPASAIRMDPPAPLMTTTATTVPVTAPSQPPAPRPGRPWSPPAKPRPIATTPGF
jgi:serine/threonine-protein kinase